MENRPLLLRHPTSQTTSSLLKESELKTIFLASPTKPACHGGDHIENRRRCESCDLTKEQNLTSSIHRGHCAKTFELLQPRCALVASEAAAPHYKAMKVSPLGLTALNRENGFKSPQDLKGDPLGVARPRLRQGATTDGGIFHGAAKSPPRYENRARAGDGPKGAPAVLTTPATSTPPRQSPSRRIAYSM